jgi:predicted nuclease of restriction endonuclease-like (RecB) superfamily
VSGDALNAPPSTDGYVAALAAAKAAIQSARTRAVLAVNSKLIGLYWDLGRLILDRQRDDCWGPKFVDRLSSDMRAEFTGMTGLSPGNLRYMRRLSAAWPDRAVCLRLVGKLPWGHNQTLLEKLEAAELPEWYARSAIEYGWYSSTRSCRCCTAGTAHCRRTSPASPQPGTRS